MDGIVATDDVMGGEPRLEGRRVSVRQIAEFVIEAGEPPADVADQLELTLAEVHLALAYYYAHPEEMAAVRERHEGAMADVRDRAIDPPTDPSR